MVSRTRRDLLISVGGVAATGLAGCSEYVRRTREGGNETDGSDPGATDAPEPDSGSDSDPEPDSADGSEPASEPELALPERTERLMDELRWYRSEHGPNRSRYVDGLKAMKSACNDLIEARTGGTDALSDLETAYDEFSAAATVLSTRYPYASEALEDISDETETLIAVGRVTDNPAAQTNVVEIARDLRDDTREYIFEANEEDALSADVLSGEVYEYLQSKTVRDSDTTPVFALRVSLKRNVGGSQGVFFAGAHPSDLDDDLDGDVFRAARDGDGSADYERPLNRFVPFADAIEFDQEAVFSFGKASDGGTYRAITDVSLQVFEHGSDRAAADAVETVVAELDAERKTSIDLETGEETYAHPIGGHDWTMIEYESWKDDWEAGSDLTWRCLLLSAGRFTLVFDPYPADEHGEDRWNDLRYTWVWEA